MSNYKSYYLKSLGLSEDSIPGGKGDEAKPTQFDPKEFEMGIKVEMEHTNDEALAKEIAMDHLTEDPHYYSNLKKAGMADELPEGTKGELKPQLPLMSKLFSPTAMSPTPVIAIAVRGTRSGGLPAGGQVDDPEKAKYGGLTPLKVLPQGGVTGDPEKARLGGLERVKNLKANSQGAYANTPASEDIKADGGHFTPDTPEITKKEAPVTNVKGSDAIHPMQVQQIGNKPYEEDGTTHDGKSTPPAAEAGVEGGENPPVNAEPHPMSMNDMAPTTDVTKKDGEDVGSNKSETPPKEMPEPEDEEEEKKKGPWGIPLDDDKEEKKDDEDEDEEGKDVSIDIKEVKSDACAADKAIAKMQKDKTYRPFPFDKDHPELVTKPDRPNLKTKQDECSTCGCGMPNTTHDLKKEGWAMGEYTPEQQKSLALLTRKGFREVSTFPAEPDAEGGNMGNQVVIVVQKKSGPVRLSGEIEPSGLVNGQPVEQFLAGSMEECGTMQSRFQKLANIPQTQEAGALSELQRVVAEMKAKGKTSPLLEKAEQYLKKHG